MGANVISSVQKFFQPERPQAILVISSGDVPPNNYFSLNGFQLHGKKVPVFSVSEREYTSYYIPRRDFNFIEKLKISDRWKDFTQEEQKFLQQEYARIQQLDFSRCRDYCDQMTVIVKNTWPLLFETSLRPTMPELVYITQEELVTQCLIELLQEDNFISACLFNKEFQQHVLDNFRGIVVAWQEVENKGTHFFWRKYPNEPRSLRMYVHGNMLVPTDPRFSHLAVPLEREAIITLLRQREIYPSLFLIFSVLNFWAGVKPLAGFGSVVYLNLFKQAWLKSLKDSLYVNEMPLVENVMIDNIVCGLPIFFKRIEGKPRTLYGYDLIYDGGASKEYLQHIFAMEFKNLLSIAIPDMYNYYSLKYIPPSRRLKPTIALDDLAEHVFDWVP